MVTAFNDSTDLLTYIQPFFKSLRYASAYLLNIYQDSITVETYTSTPVSESINALNSPSDPQKTLKITYQESMPFSFLDKNGRIKGLDGVIVDSISQIVGTEYEIVENQPVDINFYRRSTSDDLKTLVPVFLYETSPDQCYLAPRDILSYTPFGNPFGKFVTLLLIGKTFGIAILWKFFKWLQDEELPLSDLVIYIIRAYIGEAVDEDRYNKWSKKEQWLLTPFFLGLIVIIALYQSFLISAVIVAFPARSSATVEELIQSGTRIYKDSRDNFLPKDFARQIAYPVWCRYAEKFIWSKWNWQDRRKLFSVIYDGDKGYLSYTVAEDFPYKRQFQFAVRALEETGILTFWRQKLVTDRFPRKEAGSDGIFLDFMIVPFLVVLAGGAFSGCVLIVEIIECSCQKIAKGLMFMFNVVLRT